ncbi:hypothetical protein A8B83_02355 [Rhodobacteraceae bacterium EhC02]|nr:hypothetical protein A8B83_02355 [Rhodobacteraceae bacterium EhC02]
MLFMKVLRTGQSWEAGLCMAKLKGLKGKDRVTLARDAAIALLKKRDALKKLKSKETLSETDRIKALDLVREIEVLKTKISNLGFDPKVAASSAAAWLRKDALKVKTKGLKISQRGRVGGVGMYGLGTSLKNWR